MTHCINFYRSVFDAYSYVGDELFVDSTYELFKLLEEGNRQEPSKEATIMFNCALMNTDSDRILATKEDIPNWENSIARCSENVVAVTAFVLDYDANLTIDEAVEQFADYEFIMYTTYNHSPELHKFRIVLPLTTPATPEDIACRKDNLLKRFEGVDKTTFSASRSFYFPSFHAGNKDDSFVIYNSGKSFDIESIEPIEYKSQTQSSSVNIDNAVYLSKLLTCLNTGSGAHYGHAMQIIPLLKSAGGTSADLIAILRKVGAPNSCLRDEKMLHQIGDKSWNKLKGEKFTAQRRDALLKDLNCKPYPKHQPIADKIQSALNNQTAKMRKLLDSI